MIYYNQMKRKIAVMIFSLIVVFTTSVPQAHAQQIGIIPKVPSDINCDTLTKTQEVRNAYRDLESFKREVEGDPGKRNLYLACAIKTGRTHLFMIPFFVMYVIEFVLSIAGLLAVLFVSYGGFKYITGALSQDKETGKKIIFQALTGLVVTLSAWIIVNLVQSFLTS